MGRHTRALSWGFLLTLRRRKTSTEGLKLVSFRRNNLQFHARRTKLSLCVNTKRKQEKLSEKVFRQPDRDVLTGWRTKLERISCLAETWRRLPELKHVLVSVLTIKKSEGQKQQPHKGSNL